MRALHFLMTTMAISILCSQCCTPEEGILGRFVLDTETGCTTCAALGPQTMTFDDEASGSLLGNYRFDFADGVYHEGMYELVYLESSVVVVLYPEQASIEHLGLLGPPFNLNTASAKGPSASSATAFWIVCGGERADAVQSQRHKLQRFKAMANGTPKPSLPSRRICLSRSLQ